MDAYELWPAAIKLAGSSNHTQAGPEFTPHSMSGMLDSWPCLTLHCASTRLLINLQLPLSLVRSTKIAKPWWLPSCDMWCYAKQVLHVEVDNTVSAYKGEEEVIHNTSQACACVWARSVGFVTLGEYNPVPPRASSSFQARVMHACHLLTFGNFRPSCAAVTFLL